ncbi:testisin-like [Erinaceus europaeus]|uniref:Testisin-like n=1 Tax=Erinaceus europaeus TaxID=9365 RepID=A0ABM3VW60_ERIEU|nr:testisin-like [Erinaceus europaeus]XP_060028567.1 testisin-like [Erinaceus europaeus]
MTMGWRAWLLLLLLLLLLGWPRPGRPDLQDVDTVLPGYKNSSLLSWPCGQQTVPTRIIGGQDSELGRWPWQGSLRYWDTHICGASLLNRRWVLSAAHCFEQSSHPFDWSVQFGEISSSPSFFNLQAYNNRYRVEQIILSPQFLGTGPYDIALLKLSSPVTYDSFVQPICVLPSTYQLRNQNNCWITGWGEIAEDTSLPYPSTLQEVQVGMINNSVCSHLLSMPDFRQDVWGDMVCAGDAEGGKDACFGDSGGPLVCKTRGLWVQVGVVSWGIGCGRPNRPGIYTNVSQHFRWIQSFLSGSSSAGQAPCLLLLLGSVLWLLHPQT